MFQNSKELMYKTIMNQFTEFFFQNFLKLPVTKIVV